MPDTVPAIISFPDRPESRLRLALHRLDEALAEQRQALGAWRGNLGSLANATTQLDDTLCAFRGNLQQLATEARHADDAARRLVRTTDAWPGAR